MTCACPAIAEAWHDTSLTTFGGGGGEEGILVGFLGGGAMNLTSAAFTAFTDPATTLKLLLPLLVEGMVSAFDFTTLDVPFAGDSLLETSFPLSAS